MGGDPDGLIEVLEFAASRTGDLPIFVTENGAAFPPIPRSPRAIRLGVAFLHRHLAAALDAIDRGVPLRGFFVWSLLDNFEWARRDGPRFGIVHVDYETLERTIRDSARFLASVAKDGPPPLISSE